MGRTVFLTFLTIGVILPVSSFATPSAEQLEHYGLTIKIGDGMTECIACHDGMMAKTVDYCIEHCDITKPHPILKSYPPAGKEQEYLAVKVLEENGGRLMNGKIVCISCHNLKNRNQHHLLTDNHENALCYVCHVK